MAMAGMAETAGAAAGAPVVAVRTLFCTATTCPVIVSHRLVYHDPWHISVPWARYVTPALASVLHDALTRGTSSASE